MNHASSPRSGFRHLPVSLLAIVAGSMGYAQQAPASSNTTNTSQEDQPIVLSPFTVDATQDKGYFAPNTLAGSRMRTNLADLGASISIVTKAQMEDFASVDVNDAFRYEVNTEGSGYYTPATQAFRQDGILDVNAGGTQGNLVSAYTNAQANRVRGIGIPSASVNYYPSIAAVPPDAYNLQSLEISRGPNSMLFGLGSPAGIVNASTAQAILNKNFYRVQLRGDDRGSFRSSFSFNRSMIQDKLAIYGALLHDDRQFERKPSYDISNREYIAITAKPLPKTVIRANFENYENRNRRPNTISPIDYVTQWRLAGQPIYDALTKTITLNNGKQYGPYLSDPASPFAQQVRDFVMAQSNYNPALRGPGSNTTFTTYNGQPLYSTSLGQLNPVLSLAVPDPRASVLYVPGMSLISQGRPVMQISNGRLQNWYQPLYVQAYRPGYNIPPAPAVPLTDATKSTIWNNLSAADAYNRASFVSTGWTNNSFLSNLGSYRYAGVTDRSIYDWKKINILQADYGTQKNRNYEVDFEQEITPELYLSGGWFRQDFSQVSNYTIGQLNAVALAVDENKYLPNGSPNPYVGSPLVNDVDPDRYINNQLDDHFRTMLAWTPDFTRNTNWTKWLGHHQILGLWSRDESMALADRQRLSYIAAGSDQAAYRYLTNPNNNADGTRTGWRWAGATQRFFYLANPGDPAGKVTRSPGTWDATTFSGDIQVYDYLAHQYGTVNVTENYVTGVTDPVRTQRTLQSWSAAATDYWWKDRLITTFGARVDRFKARSNTAGSITNPDGTVQPALTAVQRFLPNGYYDYSSTWNRFNTWNRTVGRTKTGGFVLQPFRNWSTIEDRAGNGSQFWQIVRDFGLVYNWSDNFDAPAGPQVDPFGKQLPNPQGQGRDFGFQFSALNNKFYARVTWFRSTNEAQRLSAGTAIGRLTSQGAPKATEQGNVDGASVDALFKNWARTIAKINMGMDPRVENPPALTSQQEQDVQAAAEKIWKLPYSYYESLPGAITATGDAVATGMEVQLNYNTGNWRNRFTFGKQVTTNSNVLKEYNAWLALRSPVWANAKAADYLLPQYQNLVTYSTAGGTAVNLTNFLSSYGYTSTVKINNADGGRSPQNWIDVNLSPQVQLAADLDGQEAPGQRKYRWAYNTGYDFESGRLKGFGAGLGERWESKSIIGYYGRSSGTNGTNPKLIDRSDISRPIYDDANFYTDLFINYKRKIWNNRIGMTVQLNVENVFEDGSLQVVAVNYDGSPYGYRIIDSRKFSLTTTFDF